MTDQTEAIRVVRRIAEREQLLSDVAIPAGTSDEETAAMRDQHSAHAAALTLVADLAERAGALEAEVRSLCAAIQLFRNEPRLMQAIALRRTPGFVALAHAWEDATDDNLERRLSHEALAASRTKETKA